jgi:integrase
LQAADVRDLVRAIDATGKHETAARILQYIGSALSKAKVDGLVTEVVTDHLDTSETLSAHTVEHHPRVAESEMGQLFRDIAGASINPVTRLALMLLFFTAGAMRPGNIQRAQWSEFDIERARWTIPAAKMKGTKTQKRTDGAFIVPLSTQALAVIAELRTLTGDRSYLFPNHHDPLGHMSANAMGFALNRMGYQNRQVPHGARGLFSTASNESGKWDADTIELCIAHRVGSAVRQAYNSAQRLPDRARLMQWWGDKIEAARAGATVIAFPAKTA